VRTKTWMQVHVGADGLPALYGEPVARLAADVPLRPALLGNLVPHQLNVWMGAAQVSSPLLAPHAMQGDFLARDSFVA
jgi:hypothetical protein